MQLALHELIDPRIEDSYDTYELYLMARAAYLCVQSNPEMRPSMGEVIGPHSFIFLFLLRFPRGISCAKTSYDCIYWDALLLQNLHKMFYNESKDGK